MNLFKKVNKDGNDMEIENDNNINYNNYNLRSRSKNKLGNIKRKEDENYIRIEEDNNNMIGNLDKAKENNKNSNKKLVGYSFNNIGDDVFNE